jgi:hypothetical protein
MRFNKYNLWTEFLGDEPSHSGTAAKLPRFVLLISVIGSYTGGKMANRSCCKYTSTDTECFTLQRWIALYLDRRVLDRVSIVLSTREIH